MTGIVIAFLAMLSFGVGDSLFALPIKKYSERVVLFWQYCFIFLFSVILFFVSGNISNASNLGFSIIFPVVAGLGEVGGVFFLMKSLKQESLGVSISIASSYSLSAFLYNYFILGDNLTNIQIVSILFIVMGVFILSLEISNKKQVSFNKNVIFALLSFFSWSILVIFQKYSTFYYSDLNTTIIMGLSVGIIILPILLIKEKANIAIKQKYLFITFLIAVFLFLGIFLMNAALHKGSASVVTAITSSSAVITSLIGLAIYKEKLKKYQYIGIIVVGIFLFVLHYYS